MSYLRDYAHSFQMMKSMRPEQKAIPTLMLKPMLKELAAKESREGLGEMYRSNVRYRNLSELARYKSDIKAERQDAPIATALAAAQVPLSYKMAQETKKQAELQREFSEEQLEYLKLLRVAIENYPLDIMHIINKYSPSGAEMPSPEEQSWGT